MVSKLSLKDAGELDRERKWPGPLGRGHLVDKGLEMGTDECMIGMVRRKGNGRCELALCHIWAIDYMLRP